MGGLDGEEYTKEQFQGHLRTLEFHLRYFMLEMRELEDCKKEIIKYGGTDWECEELLDVICCEFEDAKEIYKKKVRKWFHKALDVGKKQREEDNASNL